MVSANSSTSAGGLASAATGMRPTRCGASHDIARRSLRTRASTDGRCTFTTTGSPVRSRAAWTWAIEAAASGWRSNHSKVASSVAAQVGLDDLAHHGERLGRHLVAAELELAHQLFGEQALTRRDDLPELDVGRAEVLGGPAQAARDVGPAVVRRGEPAAPLPHEPGREGGAQAARHPHEASARWHAAGRGQHRHGIASGVAQGRHQGSPRHGVELQHPGRVVAEGTPRPVVDRRWLAGAASICR